MIKSREPETWKPVVGYEGLYEISSYGRLKRLSGYSKRTREGYIDDKIYHAETILKNMVSKKGYITNSLYKHDGEKKIRNNSMIHRLVAIAFIGNIPFKAAQINHINGIKSDNYYKNLEWCSNLENQIHARENGLRPANKKGWDYPHSKPVKMINVVDSKIIKTFGSIREAERETKIHSQNIGKVLKGKRLRAGGYFWEYI